MGTEMGAESMPPPAAPQSVQKLHGGGASPTGGAPTPRKLTKMSSKFRRDSSSFSALSSAALAAAGGAAPVVVLNGNGGLTPSLSSLEGQRSNPATPLFSPDTDAAFAALASNAPSSAASNGAAPAPPPSAAKAARDSSGVSPRAMAMAKAARLAQQRAGEGSPSSDEARDLNAQLEAVRGCLSNGAKPADTDSVMLSPPAQNQGDASLLSPSDRSSSSSSSGGGGGGGSSGSSRRKPKFAERWRVPIVPSPAARKPPEIVESVPVTRGSAASFTSPPPQTPVQHDSGITPGGSPSPSGKWWKEMRDEEHAAAKLMGWTAESWDAGDRAPFKAVWAEMDEAKHQAARMFKFGPEQFAKQAKVHNWAGHEGWVYKKGTGLVTFLYVAPDGRVFNSERDAQQAYDAAIHVKSPRDSVDSVSSQESKPSPQRRSPARSPILSPKSSKLPQPTPSRDCGEDEQTESQDAGAYWKDMNKLQQTAAEMLGWNSQSWDDGDDTPFKKVWADMTDDERSAALMLNFEQDHFAKPKKEKDKRGKAWPDHEGWWIRRGTGLVNWIYTAPGGTEYTDEQEALAAAAANAGADGDEADEADEDDHAALVEADQDRSVNTGQCTELNQQNLAQPDSLTSPSSSGIATVGDDVAAARYSPKAVGDFVEANYMGLGTFHGGVIKTQHPDGTFAIAYHDGDYEENVDRANIRALRKRRRVPRTDLDQTENPGRDKSKAAKPKKTEHKPAHPTGPTAAKTEHKPAHPTGPTAAQRTRVAHALRKAAESVAECSDRSIGDQLGWLWTVLDGYKGTNDPGSGMHLLKHIASTGKKHAAADPGFRRHSALFSPTTNPNVDPAGTPHPAQNTNEKAFMWERLDGKTWRQLPDGNTWQRDGLVVLWSPQSSRTLPELDQLVFELKIDGKGCRWFCGSGGEVNQGRQGKEECFIVITEAELRQFGAAVGEILVWNSDGTPDPNNETGIKLEDTLTGLPLEPSSASEARQREFGEDGSFPPANGLQVDMFCDAQDTAGGWNSAKIKALRQATDGKQEVMVHFISWNDRHDKWMSVTAGQLAPAGTMSADADSASRHRWNGRRYSCSGSPDAAHGDAIPMEFEHDEDVLEISQVVEERTREPEHGGGTEYKIRYKGYAAADDVWANEDEIIQAGAQDKLNKFHDKNKQKAERKAALEKKKMAEAKRKADQERRKQQQRLKRELQTAERQAAEAAANAARLIEKKRMELEQIQAQGGKAKRPAGSSGISAAKAKAAAGSGGSLGGKAKATAGSSGSGTKRKQSAAALNDNSNATDSMHSEKGKALVGRRLVRLVTGLTKGKIVEYKQSSDTYVIHFKDNDTLDLTLDQIVNGGIVQLTAKKRPNFTSTEMSQRF